MSLIKRYSNRKLYDMEAKHYVTLDDIAEQIRDGDDIQVVDHESGADITTLVTAQVILAQEKKSNGFLPKTLLIDLLHAGSDTLQQLRLALTSHAGLDAQVDAAIERRLRQLVKRGDLESEEARRLLAKLVGAGLSSKAAPVKSGPASRSASRGLAPTRRQIEHLSRRLADLNDQLDQLVAAADKQR